MRFTLVFLFIVSVISSATAQITDTLGYHEFYTGTPVLYTSPNGGYAFGNNGYGDKAKAQTYVDTMSFVLRGALLDFGAVSYSSMDSSSVVRVSVYNNQGFGVTQYGSSDSIAPDSVLAFVDIPMYELAGANQPIAVYFNSDTLVIDNKFSVGIDLTFLNTQDTIGLISTTDGDAQGSVNAWEYSSGNIWFSVAESSYSWGLDVDLAIFPLIDRENPAGLTELTEFDFRIYPNPVNDILRIDGDLVGVELVEVFSSNGELVTQWTPQELISGCDVSAWSSGIYSMKIIYATGAGVTTLVKI